MSASGGHLLTGVRLDTGGSSTTAVFESGWLLIAIFLAVSDKVGQRNVHVTFM